MKKNVLAFDVSTRAVGIAWSIDGQYGFATITKIANEKSLLVKSKIVKDELKKLFPKQKWHTIYFEDFAKRFSPGRSSAATICKLVGFNTLCQMIVYDLWGIEPKMMNPNAVRNVLSLQKTPFGLDQKDRKRYVCEQILSLDDTYPQYFPEKNKKGQLATKYFDAIDAFAVLLAGEEGIQKGFELKELSALRKKERKEQEMALKAQAKKAFVD